VSGPGARDAARGEARPLEGARIRVQGVEHWFETRQGEAVQALANVSLSIEAGEFAAIVGPSGCGKTTLLNMVGGLLQPTQGEIRVGSSRPEAGAPDVGYLFARDSLLPWRSAARNVGLPLEIRGVARAARDERVAAMLAAVGLEDFAGAYPAQLSQGMRQRVALGRTLITDPTTLLMDEPFSALDAQTRLLMHDHFLSLWERHRSTVLLITHDLAEAITLADRVIVFSRRPGRIKAEFPVDLPRPRRVGDLQASASYHELFQRVWKILEEELLSGAPAPGGRRSAR
jgi:NitT/TauT family transport system ATP-binding protein